QRGLNVDDFGSRLSFFFASHSNFFEEIAKFRAARRIWARIMREKFAAKNPKAMMLRFHTQTSGSTLTAQQPDNNIIRVTLQALAAVLGGTQSLHTNSRDEALALPTEESVRIALRTQQIIAHESGVADTVDPLGGSYFLESLTHEIEMRVWEYLRKIEVMGGAIKAIENKYFQTEISKNAYELQKEIESGEKVLVGVNKFIEGEVEVGDIHNVDPTVRIEQTKRLVELKKRRDNDKVCKLLAELKVTAATSDNLMPKIINCVDAYATLGEISDALKEIFGSFKEA
ncbi:MAG: methylmalonyl-CoA mutase family protein, partial [bacterium]